MRDTLVNVLGKEVSEIGYYNRKYPTNDSFGTGLRTEHGKLGGNEKREP